MNNDKKISMVSLSESELYLTISRAINYDMSGTLSIRIQNLIQEASKDEINKSLENFELKDVENYLRTKKLNNLNK